MWAPCWNIYIFNEFFQKTSLSWAATLSTKIFYVCTACVSMFIFFMFLAVLNNMEYSQILETFHFYGFTSLFAHLWEWNLHSAWLTWIRWSLYIFIKTMMSECISCYLNSSSRNFDLTPYLHPFGTERVWWLTVKLAKFSLLLLQGNG